MSIGQALADCTNADSSFLEISIDIEESSDEAKLRLVIAILDDLQELYAGVGAAKLDCARNDLKALLPY